MTLSSHGIRLDCGHTLDARRPPVVERLSHEDFVGQAQNLTEPALINVSPHIVEAGSEREMFSVLHELAVDLVGPGKREQARSIGRVNVRSPADVVLGVLKDHDHGVVPIGVPECIVKKQSPIVSHDAELYEESTAHAAVRPSRKRERSSARLYPRR